MARRARGHRIPSLAAAHEWYDSAAYREILRLRADHIPGDLVIVEGCGPDHDSAAMAAAMRAASVTPLRG